MLKLDINSMLITAVNLFLWFLLIKTFLFKPINNVIRKREEALASRYEEAKRLQDEAKEAKEQCAKFQVEIEEEKKQAVLEAQEKAKIEYDHILTEAKEKAEQIVENSKKEANLQKERIVGKAEQEIRSLILDAAVTSMQSQNRGGALYDEFLTKAGETHAEH